MTVKTITRRLAILLFLTPLGVWGFFSVRLATPEAMVFNRSGEIGKVWPTATPDRFRVAVLGDSRRNIEMLEAILRDARARADAAVVLGDLVDVGNWQSLRFVRMEMAEEVPEFPVLTGAGNHDLDPDGTAASFRRCFGPDHYWLRFGGVLFVMVNNVEKVGWDRELTWLRETLDREARGPGRIYLMMHKPPYLQNGPDGLSPDKTRRLRDEIAPYAGRMTILASHEHAYAELDYDGIPVYITGEAGAPQKISPPVYGYILLECSQQECNFTHITMPSVPAEHWEEQLMVRMFWTWPTFSAFSVLPAIIYFRRARAFPSCRLDN